MSRLLAKGVIFGFATCVFLVLASVSAKDVQASSYSFVNITSGFASGSQSDPSNWVQRRAYLKDSMTGNSISGTFTVACQATYNSGDSLYYSNYHTERYGPRCTSGSASSGGAVFMGSCTLPFNLSASATGYVSLNTTLVNNESNINDTLYPEGNGNTANYDIYLDPTVS